MYGQEALNSTEGTENPGELEHYEKRFGIIAVEKGFITPEDLVGVLRVQVIEDIRAGNHRLMGEIMMDRNLMNPGQVEEVLTYLFRSGSANIEPQK
jgi:hypothetical protein